MHAFHLLVLEVLSPARTEVKTRKNNRSRQRHASYGQTVSHHMTRLITHIILLVFLGSCSNYTKDEIVDFLFEESFLLINENQDTLQIEFLENCAKTYNWNYIISEEWEICENDEGILFHFDRQNFKFKSKINNEIIFANDETEFRLIKIKDNRINTDLINGKWIEGKYLFLLSDSIEQPPPCPLQDTILIPGVEFYNDSAMTNDFCNYQKWKHIVNGKFGIIRFGEFCTSPNQWKVVKLTQDTMVVNIRYREDGMIKYEENKKLIKYGG